MPQGDGPAVDIDGVRIEPDLLYVLSSAYSAQEDLDVAERRLSEKYDALVAARVQGTDGRFAVVDFSNALDEVVRRQTGLCDDYRRLVRNLRGWMPSDIRIIVQRVDQLEKLPSGKTPFVIRRLERDAVAPEPR